MLAASVYPADKGDTEVLGETLTTFQNNLSILGEESSELLCAVTDKGYHKADLLKQIHQKHGLTTYIPERKSNKRRKWCGNTEARRLFHVNRRRANGKEGKRLGRLRSEPVECSFALLKQSGNLARMTIRGLANVNKRYLARHCLQPGPGDACDLWPWNTKRAGRRPEEHFPSNLWPADCHFGPDLLIPAP